VLNRALELQLPIARLDFSDQPHSTAVGHDDLGVEEGVHIGQVLTDKAWRVGIGLV
jgi:hypothetical protein